MNVTENTLKPKNARVAYNYQRYPMDLYDAEGKGRKVKDEAEEEAALALGFTENPPAIPQSVAVHAMTTQPAIQAGYDALRKELAEKVVAFNTKYAALQGKYDALEAEHAALQNDFADLTVDHGLLVGKFAESKPAPTVEPGTFTGDALTDVITGINPFANLNQNDAEPAPKSRAALMADELKAKKGKAKDA